MAKVLPFKGLRYSDERYPYLEKLIAPPYDIISPKQQQQFYRRHEHNVIRLELGKIKSTDHDQDNRYSRAKKTLHQWLDQGIMVIESKPAFYLLQSEYTAPNGAVKKVTVLFAHVELEEFNEGKILPHEKTYEGPKTDRFHLLKETGVSFSPVYALYRDPSGKITRVLAKVIQRKPKVHIHDWDQVNHRLWVISTPEECDLIHQGFQGKKLLIADGHHRYSTALDYKKKHGAEVGESANRIMMCLTETNDPGLSVLPVYRLIDAITNKQWKYFENHVNDVFHIEKIASPGQLREAQEQAVRSSKQPIIGYISKGGSEAYLLKIKKDSLEALCNNPELGHSRIYYRLDVVILNQMILNTLLGIKPGDEKNHITYTKNLVEAINQVKRKQIQAAFLPGLPNLNAIWDLAKKGETMPQKSTYFLPKIITGMVMNPVNVKS